MSRKNCDTCMRYSKGIDFKFGITSLKFTEIKKNGFTHEHVRKYILKYDIKIKKSIHY